MDVPARCIASGTANEYLRPRTLKKELHVDACASGAQYFTPARGLHGLFEGLFGINAIFLWIVYFDKISAKGAAQTGSPGNEMRIVLIFNGRAAWIDPNNHDHSTFMGPVDDLGRLSQHLCFVFTSCVNCVSDGRDVQARMLPKLIDLD